MKSGDDKIDLVALRRVAAAAPTTLHGAVLICPVGWSDALKEAAAVYGSSASPRVILTLLDRLDAMTKARNQIADAFDAVARFAVVPDFVRSEVDAARKVGG